LCNKTNPRTMKVVIVAFDGFTDIDVFLPWDLLNRVKLRHKDWSVKIIGSQATHRSVCGIELPMQGTLTECRDADVVFFASGPGTRAIIKNPEMLQQYQVDPARQLICSMCSGSLILAALGLLDGLKATTYPTSAELLRSYGIEVIEAPLVVNGNVATAAGCLAAIDLVSWIIDSKLSVEIRKDVIASVQPVGQGLECIY
jgi:transcriptional regulator GlxA family with amidase domain